MERGTKRIKPGDVAQWDLQSDIWQTSYRYVRRVSGSTWEIEQLPPSDEVIDRVIAFYAAHEDDCHPGCTTCMFHTPIRDKTWSGCDKSNPEDYPRTIGWTTPEEELLKEISRLHERAGQRMTIKIVSRDEWTKHF